MSKIKIFAHYDLKTGSHYHRLHTPLLDLKSDYDIVNKSSFTEQDLLGINIFLYNRFANVPVYMLNILRKKHNFKIIIDMDDDVYIPKKHYMYNMYETQKIPQKIIKHLINADYIICATELLADKLKQYNPNVIVIPNAINFNIEQFQLKEKEKSNKLRFIYPCSLSHMYDVELLESSFKRIKTDSYVNMKTEFTLAGYNTSNKQTESIWNKMKDVYKKLGKYKILGSLPTEEYMRLYDNQDVCNIPLEVNEFNRMKSCLKLYEAGSKKLVAMVSNVIPYTQHKGLYIPIENNMDWYKYTKELIKSEQMKVDYSEKLHEFVKENYNMQKINQYRRDLFNNIHNIQTNTKDTKIISIKYDNNQMTEYQSYFNTINSIEQKSYLFEYNPIISIIDNNIHNIKDSKYMGIFSWKFPAKTGFSEKEIYYNIDNEHDVYIFIKPFFKTGKDYFIHSEKFHPGLINIIKKLCDELNIEYTDSPEHIIYSNFYIGKYEIIKDYIDNYIKPSINLLETKLKDLAWQNSRYASMPIEQLKKYTGLTYYPMHSFVLERMLSIYLHNNKHIKVKTCIGET